MKKLFIILFSLCYSLLNAQTYDAIKINASYLTSKSDMGPSLGFSYEHYFKNHWKLEVGIHIYKSPFSGSYIDDADTLKGLVIYDGFSAFLTTPVIISYNFLEADNQYEFFVDAGLSNFFHIKTSRNQQHTTQQQKNYSNKTTSVLYSQQYFIVGITGRYKLSKHFYLGIDTKSYHYIKLSKKELLSSPPLSVGISTAYIF